MSRAMNAPIGTAYFTSNVRRPPRIQAVLMIKANPSLLFLLALSGADTC